MPISNTPIWMVRAGDVASERDRLRLLAAAHWDLVVVGAGLVGLLTAFEASQLGMKVAVIEAGRVGGGSSGRGLGMATVVQGDRNGSIRRSEGLSVAKECIRWRAVGLTRLEQVIDELHIACGWTPTTTYAVATTDDGAALVDAEADLLAACGLASYSSTTEELPFRTSAALAVDGGAHLDPLALCAGLAASLTMRGAPVVEDYRVTRIEEDRQGVRVVVAGGSLLADRVVVATRFPIVGPNRLHGRLWATREPVVAGVSDSLHGRLRGMYTSVDDTGWSCRPRGGAGDGWTLMAGGPRQLRIVTDASAQRQDVADRALRHLAMSVSRAWSLHEVVTDSGVPLVGPVGRRGRCLTATGLGQWGPAGAAAAAVLLADLVNGAPSPSAELFDPRRQRPAKPRDAVRAAWVSARRPKSTVALPALPTDPPSAGTGVVGRSRRSAVAVSSDGDGNATAVSARCTHRGCIVRFDDADQQWECPCHGSRFDRSGAIIDGPATVPLNPVRPVA